MKKGTATKKGTKGGRKDAHVQNRRIYPPRRSNKTADAEVLALRSSSPTNYFADLVFTNATGQPVEPGRVTFHKADGSITCEVHVAPLLPGETLTAVPPHPAELLPLLEPYPHVLLVTVEAPGFPPPTPIAIKAPAADLRFRHLHVTFAKTPKGVAVDVSWDCYAVS